MPPQSQKPAWWKVILGLALILVEFNNHFNPAPNLLNANNMGEQVGMNFVMIGVIILGLWLVYSGAKPIWRK
ncbi:MAG: hypothetical protein WAM91_05665 [Candidatus Acidiferrales bacterium]